jgi:hypothetical protein
VETDGRLALDLDTVAALWSKTYNTEGKDEFIALCGRLTERCKEQRMNIHSVARNGDVIFLQWTMTMMFNKFPSTPVYGCTKLTLHTDGRIIEQRDYYDLWGDIFNGIPYFKGPYRRFIRRKFG